MLLVTLPTLAIALLMETYSVLTSAISHFIKTQLCTRHVLWLGTREVQEEVTAERGGWASMLPSGQQGSPLPAHLLAKQMTLLESLWPKN